MVSVILVPQGAEYQAVCRGIQAQLNPPQVIAIPAGAAISEFLEHTSIPDVPEILVMGLCGSLSPRYRVGAIALYRSCVNFSGEEQFCDEGLTDQLQARFKLSPVRGLVSDRVICSASEKRNLGEQYQADVVDMEGFAIAARRSVAMLRVVSDDAEFDLPDLSDAIEDGKIQGMRMARAMVKRPIAAGRLIRGSLIGLRVLQQIAANLTI